MSTIKNENTPLNNGKAAIITATLFVLRRRLHVRTSSNSAIFHRNGEIDYDRIDE
jgi:hypothetical protein